MKIFCKILILTLCFSFVTGTYAQQTTVKFTGRDSTNQYRVKLDRVEIFNLDQVWEEILYWPDTTLIMGTVGVDDYGTQTDVQLMQNVPNPFNGKTEFALVLPEDRDLRLEIFDLTGKMVVGENYTALPAGTHLFEATLISPQTYLLSATLNDERMTLKMINEGNGGMNLIRYVGMGDIKGDFAVSLKGDRADGSYPFSVGDRMQYTGYSVLDGTEYASNTVTQQQMGNELIPLMFDVTAPSVDLLNVDSYFDNTATASSIVTDNGGLSVTQRGVCWKTTPNPTVNDNHTIDGSGLGSFTSNLTGLTEGMTYYVRAYAVNEVSTAYSTEITFTTLALPTVTTTEVSNIAITTASCGGNVTSDGGNFVTARGVCWSTTMNPTVNDSHTTNGNGVGGFTSNITGLIAGTTYYVRAYATNSGGTAYGEQRSFTTISVPTVTTNNVIDIASYTATCGGNVTDSGNATVTSRGICWSTSQNPTISNSHTLDGSGIGSYTSSMTDLMPNTTYYVRAYATNVAGTGYGTEKAFTTAIATPTVTTNLVTNITYNSATCEGQVANSGGAAVIERGICWDTLPNPTLSNNHLQIGSGLGTFTGDMTGLYENTLYYVRAYAINSAGTAYGNQLIFNAPYGPCPISPTLVDYDGNVYNTIQIGDQCWMKENLRVTHFDDGTAIPMGLSNGYSSTIAYRYCPNNDSSTISTYGYLYNWPARMNGSDSSDANPSGIQGVCPEGWHVPSAIEWSQLIIHIESQVKYLCNASHDNSIAKALASTNGWQNTNEDSCNVGFDMLSNNISGFSVLPAGARTTTVVHFGTQAILGTTSYIGGTPSSFRLNYDMTHPVFGYNGTAVAVSVRCVRNNTDTILNQYCPGTATVTDYDGNVYKTIQIGDQCWMRENLRTTHYSNGASIALGSDTSTTTAYRYYPGNSSSNIATYGYLYNWRAVVRNSSSSSANPSGVQGICPTGWHVPSEAEWIQLTNYISDQSNYICGLNNTNIAKALASTIGWDNDTTTCAVGNNPEFNNTTGFASVPSGQRGNNTSTNFGKKASCWCATETSGYSGGAKYFSLNYNSKTTAIGGAMKFYGQPVRCVKD